MGWLAIPVMRMEKERRTKSMVLGLAVISKRGLGLLAAGGE